MYIVYLDEFGHNGAYNSKNHPKYNTHPASGLGGFFLPDYKVREFAVWFFNMKKTVFVNQIEKSKQHPARWEIKGTSIFSQKNIKHNRHYRRIFIAILNKIKKLEGGIIYYCEEKKRTDKEIKGTTEKQYRKTVTSVIKIMNNFCESESRKKKEKHGYKVYTKNFIIILDEKSCEIDPDVFGGQFMFSQNLFNLIEPPFMAKSHRYQTLQVADWICAILGHLTHYAFEKKERDKRKIYIDKFYEHIEDLSNPMKIKTYEIKKYNTKTNRSQKTSISLAFEKARKKKKL